MNNRSILAIIILCILVLCVLYIIFTPSKPSTKKPTNAISTEKHNGECPSFGLSDTLPTPSHYGDYKIVTSNGKLFWAKIDGMPFDEFGDYIEECKKAGYTEHSYYVGDYLYYGESSEGRCVQLTFNTYTDELVIQVAADANDPDKWRG